MVGMRVPFSPRGTPGLSPVKCSRRSPTYQADPVVRIAETRRLDACRPPAKIAACTVGRLPTRLRSSAAHGPPSVRGLGIGAEIAGGGADSGGSRTRRRCSSRFLRMSPAYQMGRRRLLRFRLEVADPKPRLRNGSATDDRSPRKSLPIATPVGEITLDDVSVQDGGKQPSARILSRTDWFECCDLQLEPLVILVSLCCISLPLLLLGRQAVTPHGRLQGYLRGS